MEFSEKLFTLRKANDLTQEQLAEKLEVSRQSISKWESGQANPELDKIVALSAIFNVTTDYLLKSSDIDDISVNTGKTATGNVSESTKTTKYILVYFVFRCSIFTISCSIFY